MSASSVWRLPGHELWFEGAPHDESGYRIGWQGVSGEGRAKCACGAMSTPLSSGAARKRWHQEHKRVLITGVRLCWDDAGMSEDPEP